MDGTLTAENSALALLTTTAYGVAAARDRAGAVVSAVNALVPTFADVAAVYDLTTDGRLQIVAGRHRDPDDAQSLTTSQLPEHVWRSSGGTACVISNESIAADVLPTPERDALSDSLSSYLVVPIRGEGSGNLFLFAALAGEREFNQQDLQAATVVAAMLGGAFSRLSDAISDRAPLHSSDGAVDRRFSESTFARIFDVSPLIISVTELDTGRFIEVNEAFTQACGFSRDEIIGRTPTELGLWVAPEQRSKGLSAIRAGQIIRGQEMRFRSKDGTIRDYLLSGAMVDFEGRTCALSALTDVTERKQAENVLARYRLLAENLRDILIVFREDGTIVEANRAASEAYGYNPDELATLCVTDLRALETLDDLPHQFAQALEHGIRFETRHRRRDGSTFPVEVVSQAAELGGERIVLSIVRDVTQRAEAEVALRASEERLRLALDAARMSTWEFDFMTGRRTAGGNHEVLMGANPENIEDIYDMIHPDDRERIKRAIADAALNGAEYAQEYRLLHPSGEMRWIAAHGRAVGRPARLVGVAYDIGERKRAESLLRANEERFRALAETMPQLVWTCEPDGRYDYLSRQWVEYTGIPEDIQLGFRWMDQVHPDDREIVASAWHTAISGSGLFDVEFRIRRHDGVYRWFKTRAAPLRDDTGVIMKWYGSNTDIDDLKQAEERRRVLIDTLAHDLKNPLAAIKAQSQVLHRRLMRGNAIDEGNLAMLAETATNMADLIDEMSDASKLAAGQDLELELGNVDLVALLRRSSASYGGTSAQHTVVLQCDVDELIGHWDRARLERVFGNLLANAIKYSPDGGDVILKVAPNQDNAGDWAVASVTDQGIGIPEADIPLVFERHRRGRNVGHIRGNGLGLAGAADVVRLHGGTITVTSQEGGGSTFTVRLPLPRSSRS